MARLVAGSERDGSERQDGAAAAGGTGRRTGLDREDVIAAALDLVVREGAAALTMRRLATELDVGTPTIYWHVSNRDELVAEVIRLQSQRLAVAGGDVQGTTARDRVFDVAWRLWTSSIEQRATTSLAHQTGTSSILLHHLEEQLVQELEAAGLDGEVAAEACRAIVVAVGGALLVALRDPEQIAPEHRPDALWREGDAPISDATRDALVAPPDVEQLSTTVLRAVIDHYVPG
jgi:AcrR family transcriptional regulator